MTTVTPPIIPKIYTFRSQSKPNLTISLLIPVGRYVYFIINRPMLITCSAVILKSPLNSFYPLYTALVLTSSNLHSIPPSHPPFLISSCFFPCRFYSKLPHGAIFTVFTYIYSLLIEKDLCEYRNLSVKFPYVVLCFFFCDFIRRPLHFIGKICLFLFLLFDFLKFFL